jgi:NAD+ synthase (glutamine-hydrolysing)
MRTMVLMDLANKHNGLVVGTGDMSELALGWATVNGDHMSMYGVNAGLPKTVLRLLLKRIAEGRKGALRDVINDVLDTPISPELLPTKQLTEDAVGPYVLHDFFLYHFIKSGFSPKKILFVAKMAFQGVYEEAEILKWLRFFVKRFFGQQFKRNCLPDGPKLVSFSLSPRADWRMVSDVDRKAWEV